ncbi:MAG: 7,8-didemethyl-8-hydroxy-5-deazariboflavin synthase subunit CofG [Promethearchaeota archaeon]
MITEKKILKYKGLSFKKLKLMVKEVRNQLPLEEQNLISFSKNFTLSLSNYCQNQCGYCYYNHHIPKSGKDDNIALIKSKEIKNLISKGIKYHCKEALLMSGENPGKFEIVQKKLKERNFERFIDFIVYISLLLLDNDILPHTNIGVLPYEDLKELKKYNASMGLMLESTSQKLNQQGGVHEHSPSKAPSIRINHIKNAGKLKIPFTTGLLIGIGESFEDRVNALFTIKDIHLEFGHIQEVIVQNFVYKKGIPYLPDKHLMIEELLRITGIARLVFGNEIPIQVPPNLIKGYEKDFLDLGIDDFGGISPLTLDYINPSQPWPNIEELHQICSKNGFHLKERLPIYDKFINNSLSPRILSIIAFLQEKKDIGYGSMPSHPQ